MQRQGTQRNTEKEHAPIFTAVYDSRKRRVRGLWQRGERYWAQIRMDRGDGKTIPRRVPLKADNLPEAKAELERARTLRRSGDLEAPGKRPLFAEFAAEYIGSQTLAHKKLSTRVHEGQSLARWIDHFGSVRLDKITPPMVHAFREKRLAAGTSARTVNLDVVALRNALKLAVERGVIARLPEIKQLKQKPPPRRPLMTPAEFSKLMAAATEGLTKSSILFRFYLRFLALTGAREQEALAVQWGDVDFDRGVVTIGRRGESKNHKARDVDFSPELKALLLEMHTGRPPDSVWLFPSPQRVHKDARAKTLRESLLIVRKAAGLDWIGFHDLRHSFASQCVMAGIDFMTIASWLGHSDGGILVGKVYGHLADSHKKAAAQKLSFFTEAAA